MGFFIEPEEVMLEFEESDGKYLVYIKSEMDTADQERLERDMVGVKEGVVVVQPSYITLLELNVLRIVKPGGEEIKNPTREQLGRMGRAVSDTIVEEVGKLNPPLPMKARLTKRSMRSPTS